jgi:hypothetical protein
MIFICLQAPLLAFGTMQSPDKLMLEGKEYELHTYILEAYFEIYPEKRPESKDLLLTSLHRGYWATYEIINGVCYLTDVILPISDTTKHNSLEVIYESVIHEIFPTEQGNITVDWFTGLLHMTSKYEYEGEPIEIVKHTILELNNSKTGSIRNFTDHQLEEFRENQFELFKKTKEYNQLKEKLRNKSIDNAKIEEIVKYNILYYIKAILPRIEE